MWLACGSKMVTPISTLWEDFLGLPFFHSSFLFGVSLIGLGIDSLKDWGLIGLCFLWCLSNVVDFLSSIEICQLYGSVLGYQSHTTWLVLVLEVRSQFLSNRSWNFPSLQHTASTGLNLKAIWNSSWAWGGTKDMPPGCWPVGGSLLRVQGECRP